MTLSPHSFEEKPYNVCLNCIHIGKNCDGPNFLAMTTERWCDWCHLRKEYLGWTNAHVAELAGVSKISVDRIMSGNVKDLRNTTMQAVTKALVNGSWGQYPCAMTAHSGKETVYVDNPALVEQCKQLQTAMDRLTSEHKAELDAVRASDQRKIDFLREQIAFKEHQMDAKDRLLSERYDFLKRKDRIMVLLGSLLAVALAVIITALLVDCLNPNIGFFWLDR